MKNQEAPEGLPGNVETKKLLRPLWRNLTIKAKGVERYGNGESATVIAREYGTTRNAVIGQAYRQKLFSPRKVGVARKKKPRAPSKPRTRPNLTPSISTKSDFNFGRNPASSYTSLTTRDTARAAIINDGKGVGLFEREAGQCAWPVDSDGEIHVCGAPIEIVENSTAPSWCSAHREIGLVKRRARTPRPYARAEKRWSS